MIWTVYDFDELFFWGVEEAWGEVHEDAFGGEVDVVEVGADEGDEDGFGVGGERNRQ
jgi:hypothetical protein